MKKIFYLLLLMCLPLASCSDDNEVVQLTNDSPELTVISVSPQRGYVGAEVTIEGTDFGADASLVSVFFSGVEEAAEMISCEDTKIVVKVPAGATDGPITVKVREMTIQTDNLPFTVVPDPVMESVSPESVYAGTEGHNEIVVTGSNFGTAAEDVLLYLVRGEDRIDAEVSACEDNKITATIPEAALFGEFDVKMEILGRAASGSLKLTLNQKAVITDISTNHAFGSLYATPGTELTITGTNFGDSKEAISVKIGDLDVTNITSFSDIEIKATIPSGFITGDAVTVVKDGITTTSEKVLTALILTANMDISEYALKNYKQDFVADPNYTAYDGWSVPADWTVNDAAKNKGNDGSKVGGLHNNTIIMQAGQTWDKPFVQITNGKIYQTTTLPAGSYKLTVTFSEYYVNGGNLFLVVNKGTDLPDISEGALSPNDVCASETNTFNGDNGSGETVELTFNLSEQTEVSIGFVATFGSANNNFRATNFKLEYTGETTGGTN